MSGLHKNGEEPPLTGVNADLQAADADLAALPDFDRVFRVHAPFVWRALQGLGVREADLEDVCQEVFLVVHRKLGAFQGRSSIRTWIYGIALHAASEYRRRPHLRREEIAAAPPEQSLPAPQHEALELRRAAQRLDAALARLDDDKRAVFVLYEIEELPMSEVAEAVGCPLQTAYSRLHAARRLVEEALSAEERGEAERPRTAAAGVAPSSPRLERSRR
ncbi:RNA polymerase sigma factor RpoE [Minicystis rosea]|nr:RNA polymerase sigma factor RpoE [Minicystis rosea]